MMCSVEKCDKTTVSRLKPWCEKHYRRMLRTGSTDLVKPTTEERFWSKVDKSGPWCEAFQSHCWVWTRRINDHGYGQFMVDGKSVLSHRFSYGLVNQFVPPMLDHGCHVRRCVNQSHLRPATPKQNAENRSGPDRGSRSGVRGVYWVADCGRWKGQIKHGDQLLYLGLFDTIAEAEVAVIAKRNELFTHNILDRVS